jgi:maltooligosyltrehalose synthase
VDPDNRRPVDYQIGFEGKPKGQVNNIAEVPMRTSKQGIPKFGVQVHDCGVQGLSLMR